MMRREDDAGRWILAGALLAGLVLCGLAAMSGCDAPGECPSGECDQCPAEDWPAELRPCDASANPYRDRPPVDVPKKFRVPNYAGGSCNHASMQQVLRWQGLHEIADWWRKTYSGGESAEGLARKAEKKGLAFAATFSGDVEFLEWASRTRRGAAIHYFPNHAVTFCGFAGETAILLDNNRTGVYIRVPKATFIARWRGYGGRAITVVYTPPPPRPWVPVMG